MELNEHQKNAMNEILELSRRFVIGASQADPRFEGFRREMIPMGVFLTTLIREIRSMPKEMQIATFKNLISNMQKELKELDKCDT